MLRLKKFGLIFVEAERRAAIADLLIGSVAQRVFETAKVPVLLVKQLVQRLNTFAAGNIALRFIKTATGRMFSPAHKSRFSTFPAGVTTPSLTSTLMRAASTRTANSVHQEHPV